LKTIVKIPLDMSGCPDQRVIKHAVAVLRKGSLIILPTDTVYGLAADSRDPGAEKRLCRVKQRSGIKPVPLLVSDCAQIEEMGVELSDTERELAARYWPGALTIVLSVRGRFEGFRIPDHPVALAVIRAAGNPLRVTSANMAGEPPALTAQSAFETLGNSVELVLDGGPVQSGQPSTVVKIDHSTFQVVRAGAISESEITAFCLKAGLKNAHCD